MSEARESPRHDYRITATCVDCGTVLDCHPDITIQRGPGNVRGYLLWMPPCPVCRNLHAVDEEGSG